MSGGARPGRTRWTWIPIRVGLLAIVVGFAVILLLGLAIGGEATANTQLPYVLVAGGAGVGLVTVGATIAAAQRLRFDRCRIENATARLLTSAARLAAVRDRSVT